MIDVIAASLDSETEGVAAHPAGHLQRPRTTRTPPSRDCDGDGALSGCVTETAVRRELDRAPLAASTASTPGKLLGWQRQKSTPWKEQSRDLPFSCVWWSYLNQYFL